ncbi:PfkB family carbohydrate kinase [Candidatus Saccharibacteria bacterium]|nr:PfkB family carbohydrate kinase [Candidatus Saccharibacteria bacterium]
MAGNPKVLVIGQVTQDVLTGSRYPKPVRRIGGKGFNQAVQFSTIGAEVTLATAVGWGKPFKKEFQELAKRNHINTDHVIYGGSGDAEDTTTVIVNEELTGRTKVYVANEEIMAYSTAVDKIVDLVINGALQPDIISTTLEIGCTLTGIKRMHDHYKKQKNRPLIVLNPAPLPDTPRELEQLGIFDIITPNRYEADILLGSDNEDPIKAAKELRKRTGCPMVCVTLDEDGVAATNGKESFVLPLPDNDQEVTDTIGASSVFTATLAVEYRKTGDFRKSVSIANKMARDYVSRKLD